MPTTKLKAWDKPNRYGVLCRRSISKCKKNGGNHVQEQNMHVANETTRRTPNKVHLFSFGGGGGGEGGTKDGILKFLCSHHIPNVFSRVFNGFFMLFLKFQMCFPKAFLLAPHFIPYTLPKVLPFSSIQVSQMGSTPSLHKIVILRNLRGFFSLSW